MRIAVIHDWLVDLGGAEKVLEKILECYPEADVFSSVYHMQGKDVKFLQGKKVNTSFIQKLPWSKGYKKYLPLLIPAMENLDLSKYDVIISSSSSVAKSIITGPDQLHICYCHSPMRYAWDLQNQYLQETGLSKGLKSILARSLLFFIRNWDYRTSNSVDYFIANSKYIKRRIEKCYRREAVVIYPGVETKDFQIKEQKDDYYFTCSRMVPYKKIDLIVRAFSKLPEKRLIVIGDGPEHNKIKSIKPDNVELLGYQPFPALKHHLSSARAFIYAAEEDFGIVPVEAQACGTPVIAYKKGGLAETVIEGVTGVFFDEQSEQSLISAIYSFEKKSFDPKKIRENAERFSSENFTLKFKEFVDEKILQKTSL